MPSLNVVAPSGAHFEFEEVKTKKGTESLGEVPILVWDDPSAAIACYGNEGIIAILDGTSLRVSFQSIARRMRVANKTDDEIAQAMIDFRPGKRAVGQSTPVSRAANAAKKAADKVDGDTIAKLLEAIASGKLSSAELAALTA